MCESAVKLLVLVGWGLFMQTARTMRGNRHGVRKLCGSYQRDLMSLCNNQEKLCVPPKANVFADRFLVGSSVYYDCNPSFTRGAGAVSRFTCSNVSGHMRWIHEGESTFECTSLHDEITPSPYDSTREGTRKNDARTPDSKQETNSSALEGFCSPKFIQHATLNISKGKYPLGQELHFRCDTACPEWPDISSVVKCVYCNGKVSWAKAGSECIEISENYRPALCNSNISNYALYNLLHMDSRQHRLYGHYLSF
ncbi:uncharacterized protein [Ambystoma mexicanum]|uniref:uncharacterized protein isoform X2 n=1 Tax=Ambystoma mexicanum TaxID=8296 RepID=UPI0037E9BBDA